ncbi:MAG: uracil-DNA glycosylase family protein [Methanomicrobiales archaeon]|nr:uracil-DNA glycosylase family protein [Methanomicrobiales archaeon]MDI6875996.1 uracil-DNA glycosylase family protein [Methanomicrobiales archaeon]
MEGATRHEQLVRFRGAGLFLTDTIKCVFYKNRKPAIPSSLIRFSARSILEPEIARIDPDCICALGNTALAALRCMERFHPFPEAGNAGATRKESLNEQARPGIIPMPFPNQRNRGRPCSRERMDAGFETVRALVDL